MATATQFSSDVERIIEWIAESMQLSAPWDQSTLDSIIDELGGYLKFSQRRRDDFQKISQEIDYTGNTPGTLLQLYDVLGAKSGKAMAYGIRGFEFMGRDYKEVAKLENPEGLFRYMASVLELDELQKVQEFLLFQGFYSADRFEAYKHKLSEPLLIVAIEISERLRDVKINEYSDGMTNQQKEKLIKEWYMKISALEAAVIALQFNGENPDENESALRALAAYETVTGTYQSEGFMIPLMKEHAKRKYGLDKPFPGHIPESLKADTHYYPLYRLDWDQYFRWQWFGAKQPERVGAAQQTSVSENIQWEPHLMELKLLGINPGMSYKEARAAFRSAIKEVGHAFAMHASEKDTEDYQTATRAAARIIDAWNNIHHLYAGSS